MIILILWDMSETYSEPFDHWIFFWYYIFENFRLKMNKNTFLAHYDFITEITTFLSLEKKSLDAHKGKVAGFSSNLNDSSVRHMPFVFPYLH